MISKYRHNELNWVDLESPKEEELNYVLDEYSVPSYIREKIAERSTDDRMSLDYDYIFTSINYPETISGFNSNNKLVFIVNDGHIISIHDEPILALKELIKDIEMNINASEKLNLNNNKTLFAHLLKNLFASSQQKLVLNNAEIYEYKKEIYAKSKKIKLLTTLLFVSLGAIMLISIYVFSHI
jgi:Mg2+ and Co2+ transporter CorA